MTKRNINPKRAAAIAMLKAGTATVQEVADLAGVSHQHASRWIQVEDRTGKRTLAFDWQERRRAHLQRIWDKRMAKNSAVDTLR